MNQKEVTLTLYSFPRDQIRGRSPSLESHVGLLELSFNPIILLPLNTSAPDFYILVLLAVLTPHLLPPHEEKLGRQGDASRSLPIAERILQSHLPQIPCGPVCLSCFL